jgi:two-component system sensor histidine kinase MtrB
VGTAANGVAFLPPIAGQAGAVSAFFTNPELISNVISSELRSEAETSGEQVWQSVALPGASGATAPGVAAAQVVRLASINYVLVLVYSFSPEQTIMDLIARIIQVGAVAVVVILVLVTYLATRQAVRPVKDAAKVASRLAAGELGERMKVRGQTEMATLAASFNAMAASLQRHIEDMEHLSKLQRRFVADVSHELRTPLATIRMAGDLIHQSKDTFDPEVARSAELLASQLDRFEALLADLLEISKLDAGAGQLDAEMMDLTQVVAAALDTLEPLAAGAGTAIRRHFPDHLCIAMIDPSRVERIVSNLVANSIQHADSDTTDIYVAGNEQATAVVVLDHGKGLSRKDVERVFDRFWRADPARSRTTGGTGLGLSIAAEDAKAHGGRIDVWAEPGKGTSFRLVLPREFGAAGELTAPIELVPRVSVAS